MKWAAVLALGLLVAATACSDRTDTPDSAQPTAAATPAAPGSSADVLARVHVAIQKASSYRIAVTASNFGLTQWGGSDGGTVEVDENAGRVEAVLQRTGDGGPYTIIQADGQTVFKRATCNQWARMPGGGVAVLEPFLVSKTIAKIASPAIAQDARGLVIQGNVDQLGAVTVIVDPKTFLPSRLEAQPSGVPEMTWVFSDWGRKLTIDAPKPSYDRGPGGNPC